MREYPYNTIFYDRKFLKVDDFCIPIVLIGNIASDRHRNQIISKKWEVLAFSTYEKLLFTSEELRIWFNLPDFKGNHFRTQNKFHDDFSEWLISGIDEALTIEHVTFNGNILEMKAQFGKDESTYTVSTTSEFYYLLSEADEVIHLGYSNDVFISDTKVCPRPEYPEGYYVISDISLPGYYVFDDNVTIKSLVDAKVFHSEAAAKDYLRASGLHKRPEYIVEYISGKE